jgi:hypothetical protein
VAARAGVLVTDSILQEAFRSEPNGDPQLIEEAKRILRLYLAEVVRHYQVSSPDAPIAPRNKTPAA